MSISLILFFCGPGGPGGPGHLHYMKISGHRTLGHLDDFTQILGIYSLKLMTSLRKWSFLYIITDLLPLLHEF